MLDQGRVRYDGPVTDLVRQRPAGSGWPTSRTRRRPCSWRTGTGRYRNVAAHARDGVRHVQPSLEDAYLLLRGGSAQDEPAAEAAS